MEILIILLGMKVAEVKSFGKSKKIKAKTLHYVCQHRHSRDKRMK